MDKNWIERYNQVNNSYNKKLVFRLGARYGFFSEFNNMICAIIYCLQNKIQFVLSSSNNHLFGDKGWNEFFIPFSTQSSDSFHHFYNSRPDQIQGAEKRLKWRVRTHLYKFLTHSFLTQDLWRNFHNKKFVSSKVKVSELNIDHTFLETAKIIVENIFIVNTITENEINLKIQNVELPSEFSGLHIRSGDKRTEHQLYSVSEYIKMAQKVCSSNNVFIATDDYSNIELAKKAYPELNIFTLCKHNAKGHDQGKFNQLKSNSRHEAMVDLFTDIKILMAGANFIGTYSSNIGTFIGMARNGADCYGVDYEKWKFWIEEDFV